MKVLLKYIIAIIFAIAFFNDSETNESNNELLSNDFSSESAICYTNLSEDNADIYFTIRPTTNYTSCAQNSNNRTNNTHKHNFKFFKTGKFVDSYNKYIIQKKTTTALSLLIKPINRLISFGKLII